jgi:tetratricopeptide (TPR) repeat protein
MNVQNNKMTTFVQIKTLCLLLCVFFCACALQKRRDERQVHDVLSSSAGYYIDKAKAAADSGNAVSAILNLHQASKLVPYEPALYNNIGALYFHLGMMDSAISSYLTAIRIRPSYSHAYGNLAQAYLASNRYPLALAAALNAVKYDEKYADGYILKALALEKNGQPDEAIATYISALALIPDNSSFRMNLGSLYYNKGMLDEAILQYQTALEIEPQNAKILFNLGNAFARKCWLDRARDSYEAAIRIDSTMASAWNNHGLILINENQPEDALRDFQKASQIDSGSAIILYNLSIAYSLMDSLKRSLVFVYKAISRDSSTASFYLQKANVLMQVHREDEALAAIQKAIQIEPSTAIAYNNLGNILIEKNDPRQAQLAFEKAVELWPDNLERRFFSRGDQVVVGMNDLFGFCVDAAKLSSDFAHMYDNLGKAYLMMGLNDQATASFKKAVEIQPLLVEPYENLAVIYTKEGKKLSANSALAQANLNRGYHLFILDSLTQAEKALKQAIFFSPGFSTAYAYLGLLYEKLHDSGAASTAFDKALKYGPLDASVHLAYGRYLSGKGQWQDALGHFQKAVDYDPHSLEAREKLAEALQAVGQNVQSQKVQAEIHFFKGQKFEYAGDWDAAFQEYAAASALDSSRLSFIASQGSIMAKKHLWDESLYFFQKVLTSDSTNTQALYGMALVYGDRKKYTEAIKLLEKVVRLEPDYANAYYALAVNCYFTGDLLKAMSAVHKAQDHGLIIKQEFLDELEKTLNTKSQE